VSARSLLFVPGDSDRKLAKCMSAGADLVILDLEDSVVPAQKAAARGRVREFLSAQRERSATQLWVRINAFDSAAARDDLAALVGSRPDGIVQPKVRGPEDVLALASRLEALERKNGVSVGAVRILPVATETAAAVFSLGGYARCAPRLFGLTWGAEDLSSAIGATANKDAAGEWTAPYQVVRALCLFGAHAAGVAAIDTLYADFRDPAGLRAACALASRDGFSGKLAIHPDQVAIINECFAPTAAEIAAAREIVALFAANPGVAALQLGGQMLDLPHLRQAERTLARAGLAPHP
jgi:citrate lyase subunit beta/citryl-CoA lyase